MGLFDKVFGSHSDKELKRISKTVDKIEALDESMQKLSDEELRHKTVEFKERLANGETLDDLLPEAYATVREASSRAIGLKHYRVQLIGGIILHKGRIAEMRTGEGKTLVSTLPAYLNALEEKGVHIVTVNDSVSYTHLDVYKRQLVERFNENVNDYNELLEENKSLKSKISDLKRDVSLIYESTKEFLKERTDGLKAFKKDVYKRQM